MCYENFVEKGIKFIFIFLFNDFGSFKKLFDIYGFCFGEYFLCQKMKFER